MNISLHVPKQLYDKSSLRKLQSETKYMICWETKGDFSEITATQGDLNHGGDLHDSMNRLYAF